MKENIIVALIFLLTIVYVSGRIRTEKDEKFDKLRMTTSTFDKMKNLHKNTYYTAVKAIIGKMGSILYKELPKTEKRNDTKLFKTYNFKAGFKESWMEGISSTI
uniref:Uncharacterized protein n=1 Tax=Panagrolaimus superbus TaxID=310955 RepID=A0A914Z1H1_9BILA